MESRSELAVRVVEVLPGSRFLVIVDADDVDLPDRDELGDLRYHARKQMRAPVLGMGVDEVFLVESVVAAVVNGVISPAVWAPFPAAGRWLERTIRARRAAGSAASEPAGALTPAPVLGGTENPDPDFDPVARAVALVRRVLSSRPDWAEPQLESVKGDDVTWTVQLSVADRWKASVHMSHDGHLVEIAIDPVKR
ncbi:hypothetical protein KGA66_10915 [Actinocrinis puniceicyclus]|uniref:Uncharacterized protein n=1 Tax=Actinocrinis puniceicyclus TaxID=977794 RepID=A0A8J7WML9_9ACTN|nr:hypothetical protein [Actinocrinis puniceicyclus]MBS2963560.1 hypothetical protein [Actinocrinis puniceicyclus]